MTELLKLPEFLEKQSKSSSGIMLIIVCIGMGFGSLLIYADIQIEYRVLSVLGVIMVSLSVVSLVLLYYKLSINEEKLRFQILGSSSVQMKVDQLNLLIKLMEYNEKFVENDNHKILSVSNNSPNALMLVINSPST